MYPRWGGLDPARRAVVDPALTGLRHAGIVVSRAQGALGLLPFAVRLGVRRSVLQAAGPPRWAAL